MTYILNESFYVDCGFEVTAKVVSEAASQTNLLLSELPTTLYKSLDFKTISSMVGAMFCDTVANLIDDAIVNPIEKGHPDILPISAEKCTEAQLRNYPQGLEVKTTVGNVKGGSGLRAGQSRVDALVGITWQAHHREVSELLGLVWDHLDTQKSFRYPAITAAFYSGGLEEEDWGEISGTTGRNTKVTGMRASGKKKMGEGWVVIIDHEKIIEKYTDLLAFEVEI